MFPIHKPPPIENERGDDDGGVGNKGILMISGGEDNDPAHESTYIPMETREGKQVYFYKSPNVGGPGRAPKLHRPNIRLSENNNVHVTMHTEHPIVYNVRPWYSTNVRQWTFVHRCMWKVANFNYVSLALSQIFGIALGIGMGFLTPAAHPLEKEYSLNVLTPVIMMVVAAYAWMISECTMSYNTKVNAIISLEKAIVDIFHEPHIQQSIFIRNSLWAVKRVFEIIPPYHFVVDTEMHSAIRVMAAKNGISVADTIFDPSHYHDTTKPAIDASPKTATKKAAPQKIIHDAEDDDQIHAHKISVNIHRVRHLDQYFYTLVGHMIDNMSARNCANIFYGQFFMVSIVSPFCIASYTPATDATFHVIHLLVATVQFWFFRWIISRAFPFRCPISMPLVHSRHASPFYHVLFNEAT